MWDTQNNICKNVLFFSSLKLRDMVIDYMFRNKSRMLVPNPIFAERTSSNTDKNDRENLYVALPAKSLTKDHRFIRSHSELLVKLIYFFIYIKMENANTYTYSFKKKVKSFLS